MIAIFPMAPAESVVAMRRLLEGLLRRALDVGGTKRQPPAPGIEFDFRRQVEKGSTWRRIGSPRGVDPEPATGRAIPQPAARGNQPAMPPLAAAVRHLNIAAMGSLPSASGLLQGWDRGRTGKCGCSAGHLSRSRFRRDLFVRRSCGNCNVSFRFGLSTMGRNGRSP